MCEWRSDLNPEYRCKKPALEESGRCIFHLPMPKDAKQFDAALQQQIRSSVSLDTENSPFDFTGYIFPSGLYGMARGEVSRFGSSIPSVIQGGLVCVEAIFSGNVCFTGAQILGEANFSGSNVAGSVIFFGANVLGSISFGAASIVGQANLQQAVVGGQAVFGRSEIGRSASFLQATVRGEVNFRHARIGDGVSFDDANLEEDVCFSDSVVGGDIRFVNTKVGGRLRFWSAQVVGAIICQSMSLSKSSGFQFNNCSIGDGLRLEWMSFPAETYFDSCKAGGIRLGIGKPNLLGWGQERCGVELTDAFSGESFWRFARRCFEKEGKRAEADASYYFERMWRWKALRQRSFRAHVGRKSVQRLNRYLYTAGWFLDCVLLRWPTAYGSSLARLFATWLLLIGGFGLAYYVLAQAGLEVLAVTSPSGVAKSISTLGGALYFSTTTFTTLGFGDIHPFAGIPAGLAAAEAVLGGVTMALTVLVIGRKFMR